MNNVPGTRGYDRFVNEFIEGSQSLKFSEVCKDFLEFLPSPASRVLDAGAGVGQNAAALAEIGHSVVAVEPMPAFLDAARRIYSRLDITWIEDSLPLLKALGDTRGQFDFALVDGVWHHLDEGERARGMSRISTLLDDGGTCAISLRNGPPGGGKHLFPTDVEETTSMAEECGLDVVLRLANQPSIMKHKPGVTWSRIVARKP